MSLLGAIYGAAVGARNVLYDRGILHSRRLAGPVVSVGNLSVGGSGKTPFVILLGGMLKQRGVSFDVLSRGYGRCTRGVLLVDPLGSARDFGDEPLLIARKLGRAVVVSESRYEAGVFAENKFGPQLHILDDGFQHRALARDFDIVLLNAEDMPDQLLPSGRLREPLASLRRADAVVLADRVNPSALRAAEKPIWRVQRGIHVENPPANPVVFCGIARPRRFLDQLASAGLQPVAERIFRDHHAYSDTDVQELIHLKNQSKAGGFITTEKDAVNLASRLDRLGSVSVAQVTMKIVDPADAVDTMLRVLADRKPLA